MKNTRLYFCFLFVMCMVYRMHSTVLAESLPAELGPSFPSTGSGGSGGSGGGGGGGSGGEGFFDQLIKSINELIESIKRIASGEAIKEFFLNWIADWMQEFLNMWLKVLGFAFVKIPNFVQEGNWIHTSWGFVVWCTVPFFVLGILVNAYRIMKGIHLERAKSLLWVLIISMVFSFYSLTLFDYAIKLSNYVLSQTLSDTFNQVNTRIANVKSPEMQGFRISFDSMNGAQAIYLILVGPEGDKPLMRALLTACGLWFSQIQGLVILILAVSTFLMFGVLIILAIFAPFWATWSALSGQPEPMIGWGYLIYRCFLVKFLYSLAWKWMADRQLSKPGSDVLLDLLSAAAINTLVLIALLVMTWFIFWRPVLQAAMNPVYLNGANVLDNFSQKTGRFSTGLKRAASVFGTPISEEKEDTFSKMIHGLDHLSQSGRKKAEEWKERATNQRVKREDSFLDRGVVGYTRKMEKQSPSFQEGLQEVDTELEGGKKLQGEYQVFESQQNVDEIEQRVHQHNEKLQTPIIAKQEVLASYQSELKELEENQKLAQEELKTVIERMKTATDPGTVESMIKHRDYVTKQLNDWFQQVKVIQAQVKGEEAALSSLKEETESRRIVYQKENGSIRIFVPTDGDEQAKDARELFQQSLDPTRVRYWKHAAGGYITIEDGIPMKTTIRPENGVEMGTWKG